MGEGHRTVLVADADEGIRSLVRLTLDGESYRVVEAADTEAALLRIAASLPDLIVLDAGLPGAGGVAITKSLKSQPETRGAQVVLMFDKSDPVDQELIAHGNASRIYGGYATTGLNPEPYAYESGFAVKWLIQAQIDQTRTGGTMIDQRAGDLHYDHTPWLSWAAYLWADGMNPRSDGVIWTRADLESDGTHPSRSGEEKVGSLLLSFFKSEPTARSWFASDPPAQSRRRAVRP